MARNRKRQRDRRARLPESAAVTARTGADAGLGTNDDAGLGDGAPPPLSHATPDSELAEAQMALGRPDLAEVPDEEELEEFEEEQSGNGAAVVEYHAAQAPAKRENLPRRAIEFLRGSWRELHRVQWPDRRQVMQATGVVIGFVIVAGVFLGVADLVASKFVNLILYGHG